MLTPARSPSPVYASSHHSGSVVHLPVVQEVRPCRSEEPVLVDGLADPGVAGLLVRRGERLDEVLVPDLGQGAKGERRLGPRRLCGRGRVPPPQPVTEELVPGLDQEPRACGLVVLILRRARRRVDVVVQLLRAVGGRELVDALQQGVRSREVGLVPVRVDQDDVARHRDARQRPQRRPRDRDVRVEADHAPLRPDRPLPEERVRVLPELLLEARPCRGRTGTRRSTSPQPFESPACPSRLTAPGGTPTTRLNARANAASDR